MKPPWSEFLRNQQWLGAENAGDRRLLELQLAHGAAALCDLSGYALIEVTGADAAAFLHGQLSSDVRALDPEHCQLSTYNSAKGRVLATLVLWKLEGGFLLQVPASLGPSLSKRLSMYVLRSKVRLAAADSRFVRFGVCGARAAELLEYEQLAVPEPLRLLRLGLESAAAEEQGFLLRLPGERFECCCTNPGAAILLWERLRARGAVPADPSAWALQTIRAGIAEITAETQDRFVPQMLNYELLAGISFTKGCYPGQEIVARTQYRGGLKRRTLLLNGEMAQPPLPGDAVFAEGAESPVGEVLSSAPSPQGGYDFLACLHLELAGGRGLSLGPAGPALRRLPMPYPLPEAA
jgi:tRNA-modifying protein YgfZ